MPYGGSNGAIKVDMVPTGDISPNSFNPNRVSQENEEKLLNSVDRFGMYKPIVVRQLENGCFEIIGGEHRWKAAVQKGFEYVPVINLGEVPDTTAKEIAIADNARYGADDPFQLAALLTELGGPAEISSFLPFSGDDLNSLNIATQIDLDNLLLPDEQHDDLPEPSRDASQQWQMLRFKVPMTDAWKITSVIEGVIRDQGLNDPDSLINAGNALLHLANQSGKR